MKSTTSINKSSLWFGLDSYSESDSSLFFGRDEEICQLSNLIFHNVQTVIYGPSGTGKTSIINAGLFKVARENGFLPVYIRLSHKTSSKRYLEQIIYAIEEAAKSHNIDIETILQYINKRGDEYTCGSLWEYLHCNEFWTSDNHPITPLIVIDQFEELFTLCQDSARLADFFTQVSDLCDNKYPDYIKKYINNRENAHIDYPDSIKYRFVISLREDYLARLEEQAENIPSLKKNRYSLQCINQEQALEIITKPSPGLVSEDVAIQIIEQVTDKKCGGDFIIHNQPDIHVEPSILSLFCSELDKRRIERGLDIISGDLIGEFGDNILNDFYLECIKNLSPEKVDFFEERLLTEDGCRDLVALRNVFKFGFVKEEISDLIDRRLVRVDNRDRKVLRLEFTHDVLCKVASKHREERRSQALLEKQEQERTNRNIEYNRRKRATEKNVLIHKGRSLIDNSLDFGENRCTGDISYGAEFDSFLYLMKGFSPQNTGYFEDEDNFVNQQVFSDPLLRNSTCFLSFHKDNNVTPTIDGLYGVELKYVGTKISDIIFKGRKVLSDGRESFNEPVYIIGGYCGIHIDYDDREREIQRTYLDDSGVPVTTIDGYSTIKTQYDEFDNPIKIRYYNVTSDDYLPAMHIAGNYGFDSLYDKNGNEVERFFVDEFGQHTKVLSGVYGKRMTYDKETFHLVSISNIDSEGYLMADKDGYVTDQKIYDDKGRPTTDMWLDKSGKPWKDPSGTYGNVDVIDEGNGIITNYNLDQDGEYISDNKSVFKTVVKVNEKKQVTEWYRVDSNDNITSGGNDWAILLLDSNEQNRLQTLRVLDENRKFCFGFRLDYNKEGTHVIRQFLLSETGLGKNEFGTTGVEFDLNSEKSLPILQFFINEFKQYQTSEDGYNAIRNWEDAKGRVIKRMYYDVDGTPMTDNQGAYGVMNEFIDDETTKCINLDADGNVKENSYGVAYTIEKTTSSGSLLISYNKDGEPYRNDGWVYLFNEKVANDLGYQKRMFIQNANKELIQLPWPRSVDFEWEPILCCFQETNYDEKDRPLSQYFKDANNCLVGDRAGDSYTIWEYDDDRNVEMLSLYSVENELKLRLCTKKDAKGRILEHFYLDKDNNYAELDRGYSGEKWEYDDDNRTRKVSFIDSKGHICNNDKGFAQRIYWYDQFGRGIAQQDIDSNGDTLGRIRFREYIDTEKRECAYYQHLEDTQGNIIANESGFFYTYFEDDTKGRTIKELYLDENKRPITDADGDYGLRCEYNDDEKLTIITCLDDSGQPHNNNKGYGVIHSYTDENDRVVKRMFFTVEGAPATYGELFGRYGLCYEYPNDKSKIVGYLDKNGEITTNGYGYAYREECHNTGDGVFRVFFYDKDRNNTQSKEDDREDYGYAIVTEGDSRKVISLDKSGYSTSNNASGYAIRREISKDGKLCFYQFQDANGNPVADNVGDYWTEIQSSKNGASVRYVSLNENGDVHLNDLGFSYCEVFTDIAGGKVTIWRDMNGKEVIPKPRLMKRVKSFVSIFRKSTKTLPTFNCRQIGAIYDCVLGNIEGNGFGKKYGLNGTYVLLQYDSWRFGDDFDELKKLLPDSADRLKHVALLPITLNGSLLQNVGDVIELDLPKGKIGMSFKKWGVNLDTLSDIFEKTNSWNGNKS